MRNQVLLFLAGQAALTPPEQFNEGFKLYRQSEGSNPRMVNQFNAQGYSSVRLESVLHELKKLHSVSEKEIALAMTEATEEVKPEVTMLEVVGQEEVKAFVYSDAAGLPLTNDDGSPAVPELKVPFDVLLHAPAEVKNEVKLRDEFPFLNETNCPDELIFLVGKKLSHYYQYVQAHAELMKSVPTLGDNGEVLEPGEELSNEAIFAMAKVAVENFEGNQDIYDELNHYKTTGEILGQHPVFAERVFKDKLNLETVTAVNLRRSNLINYINRGTKNLETAKPNKIESTKAKIKDWERQLEMVNEWLSINDKK